MIKSIGMFCHHLPPLGETGSGSPVRTVARRLGKLRKPRLDRLAGSASGQLTVVDRRSETQIRLGLGFAKTTQRFQWISMDEDMS